MSWPEGTLAGALTALQVFVGWKSNSGSVKNYVFTCENCCQVLVQREDKALYGKVWGKLYKLISDLENEL